MDATEIQEVRRRIHEAAHGLDRYEAKDYRESEERHLTTVASFLEDAAGLIRASLVVLLVVFASCQSDHPGRALTPEDHVANARTVYTAAVSSMTKLAEGGVVDLEIAERFEAIRIRAAVMLEQADAAVATGATFDFSDLTSTLGSMKTILDLAMAGALEGGE